MQWLTLATEDALSEQVGLSLAREAGWEVGQCLRQGGNGYLRKRMPNFCSMAETSPILIVTDLDQATCPMRLLAAWLGNRKRPERLLLRIAVREIEAWLLADHDAIKGLLGQKVGRVPSHPDDLPDPKQILLTLAERAPRAIRDDVVAWQGQKRHQALGYNTILCQWVRDHWSAERAAARSPSLQSARRRLREMNSAAAPGPYQ